MEINLIELDLTTLKDLQNGAVFHQVQKLLQAAVADCENRPTEKRARKVNLQLELTPVTRLEQIDERNSRVVLDGLKLSLQMDLKTPTRKTIEFDCGVGEGHTLVFNPDSPHNHRQRALPMAVEGEVVSFTAKVREVSA